MNGEVIKKFDMNENLNGPGGCPDNSWIIYYFLVLTIARMYVILISERKKENKKNMKYVYCIFNDDGYLLKVCVNAEVAVEERDRLCIAERYSDKHLHIRKKELIEE